MEFFLQLHDFLQIFLNVSTPQGRLMTTLSMLIGFMLLRHVGTALLERRRGDVAQHYWSAKIFRYSLGVLTGILLLGVWMRDVSGIAAYMGIASAGLAIALKDLLANFFGWFFIVTRRPFDIGDRVEIGGVAGDVVDVRLFSFSLVEIGNWVEADQSTGRIIHVPNGQLFHQSVANATQGFNFIWHELAVVITFESNWRAAKAILERIVEAHAEVPREEAGAELRKAARRYMVFYHHLTPIVWVSANERGIVLTMRLLCNPRKRRSTDHAIWVDLLDAFCQAPDIAFAYPTTRFYAHAVEGKPQLKECHARPCSTSSSDS
ncbi:mechanosensitive ion channel family protein [Myxococcota bacterium]|nr:mechanosensitive ion channel family protein [Myxococcota bacterium]